MNNPLRTVSLDDKYTLSGEPVIMSGIQALVRLPLEQRQRDDQAGLQTAGFISGYRGSPIGGYDIELWRAKSYLDDHDVKFLPGVNEDLAATSVWGTQQIKQYPSKLDGVFALWYGKAPGLERSGDPIRHGNYTGTSPHGGVLLAVGDDPAAKSSTVTSQTELALSANAIPVLYPSNIADIIDLGLAGWAMSRYSGLWVALKCLSETLDGSATLTVSADYPEIPAYPEPAPENLHYRGVYSPKLDDTMLTRYKLPLAETFARLCGIDKTVIDAPGARFGIIAAGKPYEDVRYAMHLLGISPERAKAIGISLRKIGMVWPLDREGLKAFAGTMQEIMVIEEKRAFMEDQLKAILYDTRYSIRVTGKTDHKGNILLPSDDSYSPTMVAIAIGTRLESSGLADEIILARLQDLRNDASGQTLELVPDKPTPEALKSGTVRTPYFCSGCPHNTSTRVPDESIALGGIGCHTMATWMLRNTLPVTQMGGEGANWLGLAPFVETRHVFQNLGDGTYYHSGLIAIRAAIAAKANITYKLLYNDAVAMTGGQPVDGPLSVVDICNQVLAEGVVKCSIVSDNPEEYEVSSDLPNGVTVLHRRELDTVQRQFREIEGVTVIIYEQTCAAEKRRRRKYGNYPRITTRAYVNKAVCEGCGDCSAKSNCVSIRPVETALGTKREIDQSSCNADYSCVEGFCPSFVTLDGAQLKKGGINETNIPVEHLPAPMEIDIQHQYHILITGIGGTGVVTICAILAMAAHLEDKCATTYNQTGAAQKGGPVFGHLGIANNPSRQLAMPIATADTDLVIACDVLAALSVTAADAYNKHKTKAIINTNVEPPGSFQMFPLSAPPGENQIGELRNLFGEGCSETLDATAFAKHLLGDTIAVNMIMVGNAYQRGLIPLSPASILEAIRLNGVAVELNQRAFEIGRLTVNDIQRLHSLLPHGSTNNNSVESPDNLDALIEHRKKLLTAYQNQGYANQYTDLVEKVRTAEIANTPGSTGLTRAVARNYAKLMAYKDEYEVARLYSNGELKRELEQQFEGNYRVNFHFSPPTLPGLRGSKVEPRKIKLGSWANGLLWLLAGMKGLRGTTFDVFGYTTERRLERQLIKDYQGLISRSIERLTPENHATIVTLAELPDDIRGFGHIKVKAIQAAKLRENELIEQLQNRIEDPIIINT